MLISVIAVCMASCSRQREAAPGQERELVRFTANSVEIVLRGNSLSVRLEKDLFLSLETTAPCELDLLIPSAIDFVDGFEVRGEFDELPVKSNGMVTQRRRIHLRPEVSARYSIGPIPIHFVDHSRNPAVSGAVEVHAVPLPLVLPVATSPGDIVVVFSPVRAKVSLPGKVLKAAPVPIGVLIVMLLGLYMRRKGAHTSAPLSLRETAMKKLSELMDLDLLGRGRTEEFYRALTEIVREYIAQTHSIKAPERTTEELLAAVAEDSRFDGRSVESLTSFFHEADFVKFASGHPESGAVSEEIDLAKRIIEKEQGDG